MSSAARPVLPTVLVHLATLLVGFGVGVAYRGPASAPLDAPAAAPSAAPAGPAAVAPRPAPPAPAPTPVPPTGAGGRAAADAGPRARVRLAPVVEPPSASEAPEAWTTALREIVADCGLEGGLPVVDCAQWPCVGLAPAVGLSEAAADCLAGGAEAAGLGMVARFEVDVACPDGGFDTATALFALDPESPAAQSLEGSGLDELLVNTMVLGGRVQDAAAAWRCAGG